MTQHTPWTPGNFPPTRRSNHVDVYKSAAKGDVPVPDPYQWLEEYTEETDEWTTAQELFTRSYLDKNSDREKLLDLLRGSMNYAKFSAPTLLDDGRWYWFYNSGLQAQAVLYRSKETALPDFSKDETLIGEVFFDPNLLAADGTAAMISCKFSRCGTYFAYSISRSGNDYVKIFVRPTASPLSKVAMDSGAGDGRFPDEIKYVKFSTISWTEDAKGFFYQRYPPVGGVMDRIQGGTDKDATVYYHVIGTPQLEDILVYQDEEHPGWMFGIDISDDGKYLYLQIFKDTGKKNLLWVAEIDNDQIKSGLQWRKIIDEYTAEYQVITARGSVLYLKTDKDAPRSKVVTIDLSGEEQEIRDFIPEDEDASAQLTHVTSTNMEYFVAIYKRNVNDEIHLYSKDGTHIARLAHDFVGTASITNREKQSHFFVTMSGFNTPSTIARYDFAAPEGQRWGILRTTKVNGLDPDDFESKQVWYESRDGTKIPMFIVRHKLTPFDGTAPALQYGYGGFATAIVPFFSSAILTFLQTYGAVFALPNVRGGGEFGREWHEAGRRENKVNGFDDFIAAAENLVQNKYAARGKIAINGASHGGFLVGGTVVRAPEGLFGAAIAEVGAFDLLKFCKFTAGSAWTSEFGDPGIPEEFDFIYPMSPLHNIPSSRVLPATMLMTAPDDERVVPMHSYKFIAQLQHTVPNNLHPLLLHVEKGGHGRGKPMDRRLKDAADKWAFIAQTLGLVWREENKV